MRKKGNDQYQVCGQKCGPLVENDDFTLGFESQVTAQ
jgi:hypothetical protein